MSQAYIPGWGADVELSDDKLEKIARNDLERVSLESVEPENSEDYDITYRRTNNSYVPEHCSEWYEFDEIDIAFESNLEEVNVNLLTGETLVETSEGQERHYKILSSGEGTLTLITQMGDQLYGMRYLDSEEELKASALQQNAVCTEMGEELTREVRAIDHLLSSLQEQFRAEPREEDSSYNFKYTDNLLEDLEELNKGKKTFENKIEDRIENLNMGVPPRKAFKPLSSSTWKPLIAMPLGSYHRATLVEASNIPDYVEDSENTIIGLSALKKPYWNDLFNSDSGGAGRENNSNDNGLNYALNILNAEKED